MSGHLHISVLARAAIDPDPQETREWLDALAAAVQRGGCERGFYLLEQLEQQAQQQGIVRENPAQYLWVHKRFKTRPEGQAPFY